jgi:hypothetical protein
MHTHGERVLLGLGIVELLPLGELVNRTFHESLPADKVIHKVLTHWLISVSSRTFFGLLLKKALIQCLRNNQE